MKLINIYADEAGLEYAARIVRQEDRLEELIGFRNMGYLGARQTGFTLFIENNRLSVVPDWDNQAPPVLFPQKMPLTDAALLGVVFCLLGNEEKAIAYLTGDETLDHCRYLLFRLQSGYVINETDFLINELPSTYTDKHNRAIAMHYANPDLSFDALQSLYLQALSDEAPIVIRAFTLKHFATLLIDAGAYTQAIGLLETFLAELLPVQVKMELQVTWCDAAIKQWTPASGVLATNELKGRLWECLQYMEQQDRETEAALLWSQAAQIAMLEGSYAEALGYNRKAITLFEKQELPVLTAGTQLQQARLLYAWAQTGNPQFYQAALNACKAALQVFTREDAPAVFADIHHQLAVIYAEIPDEIKKKSLWAAVSVSSFQEALAYYDRESHPYEYGTICNHQGNAYTKYPLAIHSDNYQKALEWYREALAVRPADRFPQERSVTLLNFIEAAWQVGQELEFDGTLFAEMQQMAHEVRSLSKDPALLEAATQQLQQLEELEQHIHARDIADT